MKLRVMVLPFTIMAFWAVFVFGIATPLIEARGPIGSADLRTGLEKEAERFVEGAWADVGRCMDFRPSEWARGDRIVLRVDVEASGGITGIWVIEAPQRSEPLRNCLVHLVQAWQFSTGAEDRSVDVVFDPDQQRYGASSDGDMFDPSNPSSPDAR